MSAVGRSETQQTYKLACESFIQAHACGMKVSNRKPFKTNNLLALLPAYHSLLSSQPHTHLAHCSVRETHRINIEWKHGSGAPHQLIKYYLVISYPAKPHCDQIITLNLSILIWQCNERKYFTALSELEMHKYEE